MTCNASLLRSVFAPLPVVTVEDHSTSGGFGSAEGESVEELTPEEARRLLEAVQRQQLTSHEGRRNKQSNTGDRDW